MPRAMTSSTVAASGGGSSVRTEQPAAVFQSAQCRCVGLTEDQAEHVDTLVVQFGPQRFGEDHVERLGGAVGDHVRSAGESGAGAEDDDSAAARCTIAGAKWWHSCIGTTQLRCTIASAVAIGLARNGSKFGSAPAQ